MGSALGSHDILYDKYTWRIMGTCNPNYKSTYYLLRGVRVITGVFSTLNLQVYPPQTKSPGRVNEMLHRLPMATSSASGGRCEGQNT